MYKQGYGRHSSIPDIHSLGSGGHKPPSRHSTNGRGRKPSKDRTPTRRASTKASMYSDYNRRQSHGMELYGEMPAQYPQYGRFSIGSHADITASRSRDYPNADEKYHADHSKRERRSRYSDRRVNNRERPLRNVRSDTDLERIQDVNDELPLNIPKLAPLSQSEYDRLQDDIGLSAAAEAGLIYGGGSQFSHDTGYISDSYARGMRLLSQHPSERAGVRASNGLTPYSNSNQHIISSSQHDQASKSREASVDLDDVSPTYEAVKDQKELSTALPNKDIPSNLTKNNPISNIVNEGPKYALNNTMRSTPLRKKMYAVFGLVILLCILAGIAYAVFKFVNDGL